MPLPHHGLPVSLVLGERRCLVVGGGAVALRKAAVLLDAGGVVTMIAPQFLPGVAAMEVRIERRRYEAGEAANYHLVIAATGIRDVDAAVFEDANAAGVLVNAVDDPEHCSFIFPAVHRDGAVSVAVSSDGLSPALSSWLRDRIVSQIGGDLAPLAARLGAARAELLAHGVPTAGRDWPALIELLRAAKDPETAASQWVRGQLAASSRP